METLLLTRNDTVVSAAAPPLSVYCAENTTAFPLPEAGVTDTAAGICGGGAVTPMRVNQPTLPPVLVDWIAPTSGRFTELV